MARSPICTAGIFIRDKNVLLGLRNYKTKQYKDGDFWTTPGGRCDEGENVKTTLRREVEEEIGVKNFEIKEELGIVAGAKEGDKVYVFLCETKEEPILMEPEKFKEWGWFNLKKIPENFLNKDILKIIVNLKSSMDQNYDKWNIKKKELSNRERVYFQKGEIWLASIGKNIGDEEDGKHSDYERPVLIVRKFNNNIFLGIPLTSNEEKGGKYYHGLISFSGSTLILSQIRLFDAKRLLRFMGKIDNDELKEIKLKMGNIV